MKTTLIILIMCLSISIFAQKTVITSTRDFSEIEIQDSTVYETVEIAVIDSNFIEIIEFEREFFTALMKQSELPNKIAWKHLISEYEKINKSVFLDFKTDVKVKK